MSNAIKNQTTYKFYQEERLGKIKYWMEQTSSIKILSSDNATPYITNDFDNVSI